jgi:multiple sugar transport system permease protein
MINSRTTRRHALTGLLFSSPAILGMLAFFLVPFGVSLYLSMSGGVGSGELVGLRNYVDMLGNATFQLAAINTGKFIVVAVLLIMALSLGVALLLHRRLRGYNFFRTVFVFPLVLPVSSVILFFNILFAEKGAVNGWFNALGLPVVNWLNSPWAFAVLVLLYVWKNIGYNIILFFAALNSIPKEYYEVAELDNISLLKRLWYITLPLISPYMFFILIISIINSFKSFREAFILCGAHPHSSIYMLQHFMNNNFANLNYVRLSTAATMVFLLIFLLVFLIFRLRQKAESVEI